MMSRLSTASHSASCCGAFEQLHGYKVHQAHFYGLPGLGAEGFSTTEVRSGLHGHLILAGLFDNSLSDHASTELLGSGTVITCCAAFCHSHCDKLFQMLSCGPQVLTTSWMIL